MVTVIEKKQDLHEIQCDELVIGIGKNEPFKGDAALSALDQLFDGQLSKLEEAKEISGELKRTTIIHTFGKCQAKKIVFIGLGDQEQLTFVRAREAMARAVKNVISHGEQKHIAVFSENVAKLPAHRWAQAVTEAVYLASYTYEGHHQKPKTKKVIAQVDLIVDAQQAAEAREGQRLAEALASGTVLARNLTNMPGNYLTPTALKEKIVEVAECYGMSYEVMDKAKLTELGMGGVLSVAQGSAEPPYVVTVKYQGRETWDNVIGLVGKGVTFDTGGISIKPVAGMEDMKSDMGGAAAVIGALEAIGKLQPKVNVQLVVGCVENMPSGTAYKPGDVITTMSGKTVEIITTDAEGRLVLADCLTYIIRQGVSAIIDCATLTGGIVVALGTITSGAMGNNQALVDEILQSAEYAGERLWQLPLFEEYRELNKSRVADLKNSGGRHGHGIIGGTFLSEFVGDVPWVHLDNAGTAYVSGSTDLTPAGGTGSMARTIAQYVFSRQEQS